MPAGSRSTSGGIQVPTYVFAAREDHIVPWKAAYASARALPGGGKAGGVRFVLGASGHIAGAINPPTKNKRNYWAGADDRCRPTRTPGSTARWNIPAAGGPTGAAGWRATGVPLKPAPKRYGDATYKPIEPAPGSYVKEKA